MTGLVVRQKEGAGMVERPFQVKTPTGLITPGGFRAINPKYKTISAMLADTEFFWTHRGGTDDFPEMSQYAYTQSALLGFGVLEISCQRTIDGVWFGLHDIHLDRTSLGRETFTLDVRLMTWAQVQQYQILGTSCINNPTQPNRPYARLIDLIEAFPEHVFIVDGKNSLIYMDELVAICEKYGGPSRFVLKSFGVGGLEFQAYVQARNYNTWGYFYGDSLPTDFNVVNNWSIIGINYTVTEPQLATLRGMIRNGQRIVAHVIPDAAGVNLARSKGITAFQNRGVIDIHRLMKYS